MTSSAAAVRGQKCCKILSGKSVSTVLCARYGKYTAQAVLVAAGLAVSKQYGASAGYKLRVLPALP